MHKNKSQNAHLHSALQTGTFVQQDHSNYAAHITQAEAIALRLYKPRAAHGGAEAKTPKPVTIRKFSWE